MPGDEPAWRAMAAQSVFLGFLGLAGLAGRPPDSAFPGRQGLPASPVSSEILGFPARPAVVVVATSDPPATGPVPVSETPGSGTSVAAVSGSGRRESSDRTASPRVLMTSGTPWLISGSMW